MKITKTKKGNISIILETEQEQSYLYAISNTSLYDARQNAKQLAVCIDVDGEDTFNVQYDFYTGMKRLVGVQ